MYKIIGLDYAAFVITMGVFCLLRASLVVLQSADDLQPTLDS